MKKANLRLSTSTTSKSSEVNLRSTQFLKADHLTVICSTADPKYLRQDKLPRLSSKMRDNYDQREWRMIGTTRAV